MADLQQIEQRIAQHEKGVVLTIRDLTGTPYTTEAGDPCTITVLGREAKSYRKARMQVFRRRMTEETDTDESAEQERVEIAAAAVLDWSGWTLNGESLPCTPDNVKRVLAIEHILAQVEAGISRHADFFAAGSVSS